MISDSIPSASIAMASSNRKDSIKKKRVNRSAKLKQSKLDARREQWLSQVKNKVGCKDEGNGEQDAHSVPSVNLDNERDRSIEKLEIKPRGEEIYGDEMLMNNHYSDSEFSTSNSPKSHMSSVLGNNGLSGVTFTDSSRSGSSQSSRSSISSNGRFTENMSEEDEEDDSCVDDWEDLADALDTTDKNQQETHGNIKESVSQLVLDMKNPQISEFNTNSESGGTAVGSISVNRQAWRPNDAFRPQSLPNLSKHNSFLVRSEQHSGSVWGCKNVRAVPTSCPICCEDLDCTDLSFLPCSCGFMLCLFCHKRILEQDGRCPGCRKQYDSDPVEGEASLEGGSLTFRLGRSCSMITRC